MVITLCSVAQENVANVRGIVIPKLDSGIQVNYYQYEVTKTPYIDTNGVEMVSLKTEQVDHNSVDITDVVTSLMNSSKDYLINHTKFKMTSITGK